MAGVWCLGDVCLQGRGLALACPGLCARCWPWRGLVLRAGPHPPLCVGGCGAAAACRLVRVARSEGVDGVEPIGRLGPLGCAGCPACTCGLSTWWSSTALGETSS